VHFASPTRDSTPLRLIWGRALRSRSPRHASGARCPAATSHGPGVESLVARARRPPFQVTPPLGAGRPASAGGTRCYPAWEGTCRRFSSLTTSARAAGCSHGLPASLSRAPTKEFPLALVSPTEERIRRCSCSRAACPSLRGSARARRSPSGCRRRRGLRHRGPNNRSYEAQAPPRQPWRAWAQEARDRREPRRRGREG
jgi:hypothetical protein